MREPADWMVRADDRILEYLEVARETTPLVVARNTGYHRNYAGVRLRKLSEYGLVKRYEGGFYELTDTGQAYLNGDLDASDLKRDT